MQKELTTKQMELLILMDAATDYYELNAKEYSIEDIENINNDKEAIDEFVSDIVSDSDETDFEILKAFGFVDNDYKTTIFGKQYIKLFNEDCKCPDNKTINFSFINKVELNFSLVKLKDNPVFSFVSKTVPRLFNGNK